MSTIATQIQLSLAAQHPVFTTRRVVAEIGASQPVASRALAGMVANGLLTRVCRGLWANHRHPDFTPYEVIAHLVPGDGVSGPRPYVSFVSALHHHGCVSQIPGSVHVAVAHQRAPVSTPVGGFVFHVLAPDMLEGCVAGNAYASWWMATPEKALVDTLYLSTRRGRAFRYLPEVEVEESFNWELVGQWVGRIAYTPIRSAVQRRVREITAGAAVT